MVILVMVYDIVLTTLEGTIHLLSPYLLKVNYIIMVNLL